MSDFRGMHKKICLTIAILMMLFSFVACTKKEEAILSDRAFALDTLIELKIYHYSNDMPDEDILIDSFDLIRSLENTLSSHIEGSDIDNINQNAGKQSVAVSDITYAVIQDSQRYSGLTNGLFDVTAGPLIDLWAIDPPQGHVPTPAELDAVLPLIDHQKIDFQENNRIMLTGDGMMINLGAIAKGAIADEVKAFLIQNGAHNAIINLGGNILAVGSKLNGRDFVIGIQDPNSERNAYLMSIGVSDLAVVSSGDYERYFVYDGKTYHHILNTKTGFPAETSIKQVTIVAPNSERADGLSTSVLLLGLGDGIKLVESTDDVEAIFITKDRKIYITDGLKDKYTLSEGQMEGYVIVEHSSELF